MRYLKIIALFLIFVFQFVLVYKINYPPTFEQLNLGITNLIGLWILRLISFVLLISATWLFSKIIKSKDTWLFWIFVMISPSIFVVWMGYPFETFKIFVFSLLTSMFYKRIVSWKVAVIVGIVFLLIINLLVLHQRPSIISALSLKESQQEVTTRITTEDTVENHIYIPLLIRRIGYNKYFVLVKNLFNQTVSFLDLESLFFQEVHPLNTKSLVLFYWPEIFIFIFSLWLLANKKISIDNQILGLLIIFSFFYFMLSNDTNYKRLFLVIWPISWLMSCVNKKSFIAIPVILTIIGHLTHINDFVNRPLFWLDNRPIVYDYLLSFIKTNNTKNKYDEIYLSDIIGNAKKYCVYYVGKCDKFVFSNFDLSKQDAEPKALYLGFLGNLYGPKISNDFPNDHKIYLSIKSLNMLGNFEINDNIANQYGQKLIIVESK